MRIKAWAEIGDIEVDVDVTLADLMADLTQRIDIAGNEDESPRTRIYAAAPICASATGLLAAVPDGVIEKFPVGGINEMIRRLTVELERWKKHAKEQTGVTGV